MRAADVAMYVAKEAHAGYELYDAEHDHDIAPTRLAPRSPSCAARWRRPSWCSTTSRRLDLARRAGRRASRRSSRWHHPERGLLLAGRVHPARRAHRPDAADDAATSSTPRCEQCRAWRSTGIDARASRSTSRRENLLDLELPDEVARLLDAAGVARRPARARDHREHDHGRPAARARRSSAACRELGVRLVDRRLRHRATRRSPTSSALPDRRAQDRQVVRHGHGRRPRRRRRSCARPIDLGHNLGLRGRRRGRRDRTTSATSSPALGCDVAQGYLPRPADAEDTLVGLARTARRGHREGLTKAG